MQRDYTEEKRDFYEVFPTLRLKGELQDLGRELRVSRIKASSNKSQFHIYVKADRLIGFRGIRRLEREMEKQLFPGRSVLVRLHESFNLDGYCLEKLMGEYAASISEELRTEFPLMYQLYRHADISIHDGCKVMLALEDNLISRDEAEHLADYLSRIINERCGLRADLRFRLKTGEKPADRINEEKWLQQEMRAVTEVLRNSVIKEGSPALDYMEKQDSSDSQSIRQGRRMGRGRAFDRRKPLSPDQIWGSSVDGEITPLKDVVGEIGNINVRGEIIRYEEILTRNEKTIVIFDITDGTDSLSVKLFLSNDEAPEFRERLALPKIKGGKSGLTVKVRGSAAYDDFAREIVLMRVRGIQKSAPINMPRMDSAEVKRVELHCHTKMSEMDGVSDVKDILHRADSWGWDALAITDHGGVQAFTEAFHELPKLKNKDFKLLYGCEGYLVDDSARIVEFLSEGEDRDRSLSGAYVVFDIETTGFSAEKNKIIEIGAVRVENGGVRERFNEFVNPGIPIPKEITDLTGIKDEMVSEADPIEKVLPKFLKFTEGAAIVAHNASFDCAFIERNARRLGFSFEKTIVDTVALSRLLLPDLNKYKLDKVAEVLGVSLKNHHRAVDDAAATAEIFLKLSERLKERGIESLSGLLSIDRIDKELLKKLPTFHVIIIAKNETGRVNLYQLVSEAHDQFFYKKPRIPKSRLSALREGLIIGSACEAGELYRSLERGSMEEEISEIVEFYDYLEIQPIGNNEFLLSKEKSTLNTEEDLRDINRRIVSLGEEHKKPVVATCDVHFLDPEDEIFRRIVMNYKKFADADRQPPLFLRTTEEMLEEFAYLGKEKAREVVIDNPRKISDMVDRISPVRPDKCAPVIAHSDETLRNICYEKAHEIYGEKLPREVEERLEKELKSIIGNGYAVMYVIAQKLVWKSNEDGYLVGSRGSVGSSFAAFLAGITEVNSLPPHYICPKCHYYDFGSELVQSYASRSMCGCDMPDRVCPECGEKLNKTGFDIPFETFLGFKGDKEPDIDLNFSGDYQSKAHKYTEVIFGAGQTFRAGTMGTVAEKNAEGFARIYAEDHGEHKRRAEIIRMAKGCEGVLRTTGKHPGGIVVLPRGENIYSFTPLQHSANKLDDDITTHFEYHSIDHNLLKLDILGHDDPTMIRFLQDATGVDPLKIPLDDEKVMSLFLSPEALGIERADIDGCHTGTLGIPEFGTDFVIGMLKDTEPKTFSDLIRISGLSHGTDVWTGNAQSLVNDMGLKLEECICCRDDIMLYLINKKMDPSLSFKTMESVRKGKGLTDEMKKAMMEAGVPEWYIESCLKIQYMFPKAHAAAYVMMAWRVAWYKVYRPLEYYMGYFSIRADAIDYAKMCMGLDRLNEELEALLAKKKEVGKKELSATEKNSIKDMKLVKEMYARGIEFTPIDLMKVDGRYFTKVDDSHIMPSLQSLGGMGGHEVDDLMAGLARTKDDGPFLSLEDFMARTGCSKSKAALLKELNILSGIPDTNQLSLFDM